MRSDRITYLVSISLLAAAVAGCRKTPEAVSTPAPTAVSTTAATKNGKVLTPEQIRERDAYIQRALAKKHHAGTATVASATTEHAHPAHKAAAPKSHTAAGDDDAKAAKRRQAQDEAEMRAMEASGPKGELTSGHFTAPGLGDPPPQPEVTPAPAQASRGGAAPAASNALAASQDTGDDSSANESNNGNGQAGGQKVAHHPQSHAHRTPTRHYRPVTHYPKATFGPTAGMTSPVHRLH